MTDFFILEELQKIIKEIPRPRLLFKKGVTVKGFFRPYMSLSDYTSAGIFRDPDDITPVMVRFSSMLGDKGTADTRRNIKGMAVKFLSGDEVYDMICHNMPVNIINDKNKLLEMFRIFLVKEKFDGINTEVFWRYVLENNEVVTFALMLYSHFGIADKYVDIKYYTVNTCIWMNNNGEENIVRYKWMPVHEHEGKKEKSKLKISNNAAEFIAGFDPDRAHDGLINDVFNDKFPMFELYIQMTSSIKAYSDRYYDDTILWDENEIPYLCAGIMILDQIASAFENESISFFPSNTIDGIRLPNDQLIDIFDFMAKTEARERGIVYDTKAAGAGFLQKSSE